MSYNSADIRKLLNSVFSDEELIAFCYDHFRSVYEIFGSGMSRLVKIQSLIDYCERQGELDKLLALVKEINPKQSQKFFPPAESSAANQSLPPSADLPVSFPSPSKLKQDPRYIHITEALESLFKTSNEGESLTKFKAEQLRVRYTSAILAIEDKENKPAGTGFIASFQNEIYVITCAHVINSLSKVKGQVVKLRHFDSTIGQLEAEVLWFQTRKEIDPKYWTAEEDVSVLKMKSTLTETVQLLTLEDPLDYQDKKNCWCFGYEQSKGFRGDWIEEIPCESEVGDGFIKLAQPENSKIGRGVSGAPLSDYQGNIIGMIQSIYGDQVAYLIPSKIILSVLASLK